MELLKLAWRGFLRFRSKRRHLTIILIVGFFFSVFFLTLFGSLLENQRSYWGDTLLGTGSVISKNMKTYKVASLPEPGSYFSKSQLGDLQEEVNNTFSPRLRIPIMARVPEENRKVSTILFGVSPKNELRITPEIYVTDGEYPESGKNEIALTYQAKGSLGVEVGDSLYLYTRTTEGGTNYKKVTVSGELGYRHLNTVQRWGVPNSLIYAPLKLTQNLRGLKNGKISELSFRSSSFWQKLRIKRNLPEGFKLTDFWGSSPMLASLHLAFSFFRWLILGVILLIVFVSAYHNIKLMIQERLQEIGVYLTFGANKVWVGSLWFLEFTIYHLYCSLWGTGLSLLAIWGLNKAGIYSISSIFTVILGGPELLLRLYPRFFLIPFALFWVALLLSAIGPIYWSLGEEIASDLLENRGRR